MNIGAKMMKLEKIVDDISKNTRQNSSEYTEDSFHALYDLDRVTLSRKTKQESCCFDFSCVFYGYFLNHLCSVPVRQIVYESGTNAERNLKNRLISHR